jgi:hypothetical protein
VEFTIPSSETGFIKPSINGLPLDLYYSNDLTPLWACDSSADCISADPSTKPLCVEVNPAGTIPEACHSWAREQFLEEFSNEFYLYVKDPTSVYSGYWYFDGDDLSSSIELTPVRHGFEYLVCTLADSV